jgi:hypothetical protein
MSLSAGIFKKNFNCQRSNLTYNFFSPQGPYIINELVDEIILPNYWPTVDGKIDCRCSDKNDHTVANVGVYVALKRGSPLS